MNRPLKALIVEDNEDDAVLLARALRKGGYDLDYRRVADAAAMAAALAETAWDIVISDYSMPSFNGLKALKLVQEHGADVPFIIVSGVIGENVAVAAMKAGAHDYLLKSNLKRLLPAVERELREAVERRKRRQAEQALLASARELQKREEELREKNIALKQVLSQIEAEKEEIKSQVTASVEKLLIPMVRPLKRKLAAGDQRYVSMLESNIRSLTTSFGATANSRMTNLTPRQVEICGMIRSGMHSKEIAEALGISLRTVETHRLSIRRKLGISGDDANLVTFLNAQTPAAGAAGTT